MDKEGGYVSRPPLLDGSNYDYWKSRMEDKTPAEDITALGNSKALNALFSGVDQHMFKLIKKCIVAKEAWEILKTTHEGTSKVKISRLQMLTRKFENLSMKEDESIHDFYMTIMEYANNFDILGEKMNDEKSVRKIFSSQNEKLAKKHKSIAFRSSTDEEEQEIDVDSSDSISEAIVILGRKFNEVVKRMDRRPRTNVRNNANDISGNINFQRKSNINEKPNQGKGVQCHECEGFGHIRSECATYLKNQKRGLIVSWSDEDDSEGELDSEVGKHVTVLTGELCLRSEEVCRTLEKQKKVIGQLQAKKYDNLSKISELNNEVTQLNSKLEHMKKQLVLMHNNTDALDESLDKQISGKPKGIGFNYHGLNKEKDYNRELKYMPSKEAYDPTMSRQLLQHPKQHQRKNSNRKSKSWPRTDPLVVTTKKEWKPKGDDVSLIAHTSFRPSSKEDWYFDSGCSKHMTGVKNFLVDIKSYSTSVVTFGDEAKCEIKGVGKVVHTKLPRIDDVLLVKGLTANLISISQLCHHGLKVNFTKSECLVTNEKNDVLMRGVKSNDNCYLWVPQNKIQPLTCLISKEDVDHESNVSLQQTDVTEDILDKESNIESCSIDFEDSQTNKGPLIRIQKNHRDNGIFMGYSTNSRAYNVFNSRTKTMTKSNNVVIDDSAGGKMTDDLDSNSCFVSKFEPKNVKEALTDEFWVNAMQKELSWFKRNEVWDLVPRPDNSILVVYCDADGMLKEYNVEQDVMTLNCDNLSTINISKNLIQHIKTKHIGICHYFIRDLVENKIVTLEHVATEKQLADIFTKALDANSFEKLMGELGICTFEEL
ncbi:gag-protease polyprotein [Trifolium pratense]|uniref:Gag-protease polyprotein n=1 Tax=Trifolium pratense TaxID=57577 RepID=A0A2K3PDK3_TRIPR|nr:gag-protease polyprotein [Trifolium pratense]